MTGKPAAGGQLTIDDSAAAPAAGEYRLVPIEHIKVDAGFNNRRTLGDLDELAASIKSVGLLQPLTVYGLGPLEVHVIAGHRRLAAAEKAGLKLVPCLVQVLDERGRLEALLVENLHRLDIDPLEEADGYKRLLDLGLSQGEVAIKVGRSQSHVSKRLGLLGLTKTAVAEVNSGGITLDQAADLAKYEARIQETVIKAAKKDYGGIRRHFQYHSPASEAKAIVDREALNKKKAETRKKAKAEAVELLKGTFETGGWSQKWFWQNRPERPLDHEDLKGHVKLADHRKLPCHRAYVDVKGGLHYACADPASHLPKDVAKKFKAEARPQHDSYEEQRKKREAFDNAMRAARENRLGAVREALQALNRPVLTRLALEALVIEGNAASIAHLLDLPTKKVPVEVAIVNYVNASDANLLRAAAGVAILVGDKAIADLAGGHYVHPTSAASAYATAEWYERAGIELSEPEQTAIAKLRKETAKARSDRPAQAISREEMEAIANEELGEDPGFTAEGTEAIQAAAAADAGVEDNLPDAEPCPVCRRIACGHTPAEKAAALAVPA